MRLVCSTVSIANNFSRSKGLIEMRTRVHADSFLDISDRHRVRTPGNHVVRVNPAPDAEALAFLLSHTFPGHRKVVRSMTLSDRKQIQLAMWADSVNERMGLVDRVWRRITEPATPGKASARPKLAQVIRYGTPWSYPLYFDGSVTRVLPPWGRTCSEREQSIREENASYQLGERLSPKSN